MDRERLSFQLMLELHDEVESRYGLDKTVEAVGLPKQFFRSFEERARTRQLGSIDDVLSFLEIGPDGLLQRTLDFRFGPLAPILRDAEELRERQRSGSRGQVKGKRHWLIQEARRIARLAGNDDLDVEALDRMREDNPVAGAKAASGALRRSSGARAAAQGLGCWASAQRLSYRLDLAVMAIAEAIRIAAGAGLDEVVADLVERAVYITMDRGKYRLALRIAVDAHSRYARLLMWSGMGKTSITTAVVLYHLGESEIALKLSRSALSLLRRESAQRHYAAAYSIMGAAHAKLGQLSKADRAAERFRKLAQTRTFRGRAAWLQAAIAEKKKEYRKAEENYLAALKDLREPADALLVAAELVQLLIKCGRQTEVSAISKLHLLRLTEPLNRDPLDEDRVLAAAHAELVRATFDHRPSLPLLRRIIVRIKQGRAQGYIQLRQQIWRFRTLCG